MDGSEDNWGIKVGKNIEWNIIFANFVGFLMETLFPKSQCYVCRKNNE